MSFKHIEQWVAERKAQFLSHVGEDILARRESGQPITVAEYESMRPMNSYERYHLMPLYDDELLAVQAQYYLDNSQHCQHADMWPWSLPGSCYDEMLARVFVPLMIMRLRGR